MNLWRLEWLRLTRTRRSAALVGVYLFFGLIGPLSARYLSEIVDRFGGEVTVSFPDPVPADGIAQFVGNASQIGVLVAVAVAAASLTIDAHPEMSVFLRTRVASTFHLVAPRMAVNFAVIAVSHLAGMATAWYETAVLIGPVPAGAMVAGTALSLLYLAFAVGVVALAGSRIRSVAGTIGVTLVALLVMPIAGIVDAVGRWLPSHLVGAPVDLVSGAPTGDFLPSLAVTLAAIPLLVTAAVRTAASREI